ncbi:L-seryl-tRNA(Sec) selenium transferase [Egibacter rhizosphaerae]|uniref:L-seryl-tRNA(Sec) selenium transferase n=1 Tax=Egibacter rhizosphaerae TaxID=1670831 RepID=A0A411YDX9_9ACTN|nr:L-seryl-tRNA(Sec) selenium transferase [Egibacter rhizosphaerae]QBI19444.1 L-seryl-tRNA(Sec) selenium transferase [Egibacter rhizosphaerae]
MSNRAALRDLPRIDDLVAASPELVDDYGRDAATAALRRAVEAARTALVAGQPASAETTALQETARAELAARRPDPPAPVINATGVIVHTNLGRAPLSGEARRALDAAADACDLEADRDSGARSSRLSRLEPLVADACDAEAGFAVNSAAGALVLVLGALAGGREVLVSRGELVEIGGSFRLPEMMQAAGARLVEVGTTNRTRARDFAEAGDDVALILSVHPSNYRIEGFAEAPAIGDLAAVARERDVPLVHDVGSGLLSDEDAPWLADEPSLSGSLAAGADLVFASADKLLGGPQAGLLAGRAELVDRCRRHPLARAVRLDKLRIAALVATLRAHLDGRRASLPVWAMLEAHPDDLAERAGRLAEQLGGRVVTGASVVGGGAAPGRELPSPAIRLPDTDPDALAHALRTGDPAVWPRVEHDAVHLDPRTVPAELDERLVDAIRAARTERAPR